MISLQNVTAGYNRNEVLHGVSLSIHAGNFIALIGPNGSGKSTLLKLMAGQLTVADGAIQLDGTALDHFTPKQRAQHIAYFPQNRPVPDMDVFTLVSHGRFPRLGFGRVMQAEDTHAVHTAIRQTNLQKLSDRLLSSLSGGERQRAYLAMLIAQDADLLLLDEPGSFLDIRHQLELMDILQKLNSQGKTIMFAAHDLPLAFSYASRVLLLDSGKLADDSPPESMASHESIKQAFGVQLKRQDDSSLLQYTLTGTEI